MKPSAQELRIAFREIENELIQKWEYKNLPPAKPTLADVIRELNSGKAKVVKAHDCECRNEIWEPKYARSGDVHLRIPKSITTVGIQQFNKKADKYLKRRETFCKKISAEHERLRREVMYGKGDYIKALKQLAAIKV